jgi:1,2-diacylglycerol 3-beta-galactosyltransferase
LARKRLEFFYVEAGGGHKSAATALKAVIDSQDRPWDVTLTNLNHVLSSTDIFKTVTGRGLEDWYNWMLKEGWTLGAAPAMRPMHGLIWLFGGRLTTLLQRHFERESRPDLVVSLIPHFNRYLNRAVRRYSDRVPFATVITDFADIPPRVWLERQQQYVVGGTDKAVQQAYSFGLTPDRVLRASGMILRPTFYEVKPIDRLAERAKLGLRPDTPVALVLFGGEGASSMTGIAQRLSDSGLDLQLILMYGRNEELGAKLRAMKLRIPIHVQGFTTEVPRFMQMADFMLGKPGPGSITEALAMRLPVIVDCNAWTMPQERYNAEWLIENQLGMVVKNWREVADAARRMLAPGALETYRTRAAKVENRAVFEIADWLETVLALQEP